MALETTEKNHVGVGGFRLEVCIGPNSNIKASNFNIKAYTKFKSKPPNSNMVFLSRFKSHRPKNLTAVFTAAARVGSDARRSTCAVPSRAQKGV